MRARAAVALLALELGASRALASGSAYGSLVECERERCLWADRQGRAVDAATLTRQLMEDELLSPTADADAQRRLETHVRYVEEVHRIAADVGLEFAYSVGVTARHLYEDEGRMLSPLEFVQQEQRAARRKRERRRLQQMDERWLTESIPTSLNWCSTDNPLGKSICTDVKSQQQCGSCWAFAAADAIEAAVVVNSNTEPQSLSPQQFLACSTSAMATTFTYCWVNSTVDGASWLESKMAWGSDNNGCDGGMTHAAFEDAASQNWSLLTQLELPYDEEEDGSAEFTRVCENVTAPAAATISGWDQVVGKSCDNSSDASELLRIALQQQPISVAINSGGSFKEYKSGIYECPDDGDFASSSLIDHALMLVGYGTTTNETTNEQVDYWILKNSYGASWGEDGFMRLAADDKINCGLNVFPVIPTGAVSTSYRTEVDGGGSVIFCGLSPEMWIVVAGIVTGLTIILTVIGIICAGRRRKAMDLIGE